MHPDTITIDGVAERLPDGRTALRYRRALRHPVAAVWAAITEPDELIAWWCEAQIDLAPGGAATFRWLNNDGPVMHATISELDPPRLLELDTDLHGVLRFELRPDGNGCELTFSATYPALSAEHRLLALAGWDMHLDFLAEALSGARVDWPNWPQERWDAKHRRYAARAVAQGAVG
jgi:uncharacterized protein YndB with AHSA1/START domain